MNGKKNRFLLHLWCTCLLAVLLLPGSVLLADEGGEGFSAAEHEPITLRKQQIPTYEVFETFLLHASFIHETQGPDAYREFLANFGLTPEMEAVAELHRAFDEVEGVAESLSDIERASRLGAIFADLLYGVENGPERMDGRSLWFEITRQLRPKINWVFVDRHPDFETIDEAEEHFREEISGSMGAIYTGPEPRYLPIRPKHGDAGAGPDAEAAPGSRVKISYFDHAPDSDGDEHLGSQAHFEWRRYANEDGSVRVIGMVDDGTESLSLVDMSFDSDEHLRPELKYGGIVGRLGFSETIALTPEMREKSHTSLGCIAATAAAALACVACPSPPDPITCGACVAALASAAAACTQAHCVQTECNAGCVQACHLYGICSSTSGSSSPADCSCVGQRYDIPGCEPPPPFPCSTTGAPLAVLGLPNGLDLDPVICDPGPCSVTVNEVAMLRLDGSDPIVLPTDVVTLYRLEESGMVHDGDPMSYLVAEWAVVDFGAPRATTKAASPIRALRSSIPEFGASQVKMLNDNLPQVANGFAALDDRLAVMVAAPPHDANSRQIPMPDLALASSDLPPGFGQGRIAVRADFSEAGVLQGFEILADTLGGVSPQLADHLEEALVLERQSEKEHRTVAFVVFSVGDSLRIESSLKYLPKCCCGDNFCV